MLFYWMLKIWIFEYLNVEDLKIWMLKIWRFEDFAARVLERILENDFKYNLIKRQLYPPCWHNVIVVDIKLILWISGWDCISFLNYAKKSHPNKTLYIYIYIERVVINVEPILKTELETKSGPLHLVFLMRCAAVKKIYTTTHLIKKTRSNGLDLISS